MSLNTAHTNGGVLLHSGECIILFCDNVNMEFHGQEQAEFMGKKQGRLYLTTHRMIFNAKDQKEKMQSFSFPFVTLSEVDVEQPIFGANFLGGKCRAQPNGNWIGECKFKLKFKSGGAIEFATALQRAAIMAQRNGPMNDAPPPYTPPTSDWYPAQPAAYQPPPTGYYGWMPPTNVFPDVPPGNTVFMTDSPPPYPGIHPYACGPSQQGPGGAAGQGAPGWANPNYNGQPMSQDAKATADAQNAYYDPSRPQCAYVPPPEYYESPPAYTKKYQ
ncbi:WW domain-binding protein 2 isoform X2 [Odontomachus brunneus]|uniref:WW domain-binding protein 2 isoform X2 n=1 Tax=Odontomachus brunneus TaxID=486640 RepID=UPI0013F1ADB7|nr:WW domain-binding protein 2 isoform X2 [Odontomachus brunneus]XP_032664658.1 WW domain-binding protein 2 isoform X2 [Odontomachus brunneus]XP_032664659.1 WW domain-binding protein 2 isoform X2 [Odontomachus brunneus]